MNKDVIYIDIEDDITGIIGKVKAAGTKIVALVPPKRIGTLQSVVNLKLLQKAAQEADKRVVLITNDHSLTTLAAGIKIPVAKNLQSRPEIPQITAPEVPEEEIINGKELPVGDVAKSLSKPAPKSAADDLSDQIDLGDKPTQSPIPKPAPKPLSKKGKFTVPNFNSFRKKFFVFGGAGVLLVLFLVWALVFAPRATVTIKAKTTNVSIDRALKLNPAAAQSDTTALVLKPNVQQLKKAVATEFTATGSKDVGDKAKGTITVTNGNSSDSVTVPAGTIFVGTSGHKFSSNAATTVPGAKVVPPAVIQPGSASVAVTAVDIGPEYNVASQNYTVQGYSALGATGEAMAGGTKQTVTVVSQDDVEKAKQQLGSQNLEANKSELKKQFNDDTQVIDESFTSEQAAPSVSPAVGEQAKSGKLTVETTYTLVGLSRADIRSILTSAVNEVLKDKADQQTYSLGDNSVVFQNFQKADKGTFTARLSTTGQIGPKIDTGSLAKQLEGKRFGEIQAIVNQIPGVNSVDINFSPFWVTTAPGAEKIDIKFSVASGTGNGQ
ncbi:MAG TPA: hypothetical protein VFO38_03905 [Candidatus Saccharimonadales bacterium]|nr:hypothetical protein [Candidatus Saccharimonadales bacterium]